MRVGCFLHPSRRMGTESRFVYVIRSLVDPARYYVGRTGDVARRLAVHNSGGSLHTAALRPWELVTAVEFTKESSATDKAFRKEDGRIPGSVGSRLFSSRSMSAGRWIARRCAAAVLGHLGVRRAYS